MLSPRGVIRPLRGWLDSSGRWRGLALSILRGDRVYSIPKGELSAVALSARGPDGTFHTCRLGA